MMQVTQRVYVFIELLAHLVIITNQGLHHDHGFSFAVANPAGSRQECSTIGPIAQTPERLEVMPGELHVVITGLGSVDRVHCHIVAFSISVLDVTIGINC